MTSNDDLPHFNVLVGFPKCGQVSMQQYLQHMFPGNPSRHEIGWRDDAIAKWEEIVYSHRKSRVTPVFVIRDPIERMWSAFLYMGLPNIPDFPTYLINRLYQPYGEGNPVMESNYAKWIKPWEKFKPVVVEMEEMALNPNFGKLNATKDVKYKNAEMPDFPDHFRKLATNLLELEMEGNFWEGDHITGFPTPEAWKLLEPYNPGQIRRNTYRERA